MVARPGEGGIDRGQARKGPRGALHIFSPALTVGDLSRSRASGLHHRRQGRKLGFAMGLLRSLARFDGNGDKAAKADALHQRAGVKLHQDGMPKAPTGGLCWATNRMRSRNASRENVTEPSSHSLTQPAPVASLLSLEPSSSFSLFNVNYLMLWALWSCGRRAGVVQAQRQIHRAFAGCAATYALCHTRHADPPLALPRKLGAARLFISVSSLSLGVAQLSCLWLALASLALFADSCRVHFEDLDVVGQSVEQRTG